MPAVRSKTDANADLPTTSTSTDGNPAGYDGRLASSCVQCRARKIKCTSDKPVCANCVQSGQQCEYRHRLKPGLKQGVGSELLQRVSVLEEALATVNSRMAEFLTRLDRFDETRHSSQAGMAERPGSVDSASTNMQFAAASANTPASAASATPTGSVASLNSTELMPPPLSSHYSHHEVKHRLTEDSTKHRPLGTAATSRHDVLAGKSGLPEANSVPDDLPPYDLLLTLLDLFFIHVAPWTPFVRHDVGEALRTASINEHEWPILIYGIVVASLRFSFDPRWNNLESKEVYRERAKRKVVMHSMSTTSVASIEALMLVALDDVGANTTPAAWGALALATRSAVHMSLHKEEMNAFRTSDARGVSPMQLLNQSTSHAEAEERRRLFWAIFVLDRWSATATGWDLAFADDHISRQLPCVDSEWLTNSLRPTRFFVSAHQQLGFQSTHEETGNADVELMALIEVTDLLGKVHQLHRERLDDVLKFREGTEAMDQTLSRWFSSLPIAMRMVSPSNTHPRPILVQALYWATVIKLQSLVAYPLAPNLAPDPQAGEKAHKAAKQISYLARASTVSSAYLSWTFFVGARMMLLRAYRRNEVIDPAIHDTLRGLREAAAYFDLAARHHAMISRAIKRQNSMDGSLGGASALVDLHHTAFSAERAILPSGDVTPKHHQPTHGQLFHDQPTMSQIDHSNQPSQAHTDDNTSALDREIGEETTTFDDLMQISSIHGIKDTALHAATGVHIGGTPLTSGHSVFHGGLPYDANGDVLAGTSEHAFSALGAEASWWDNDLLGHSFASWFDLSLSPTVLDTLERTNDGTATFTPDGNQMRE